MRALVAFFALAALLGSCRPAPAVGLQLGDPAPEFSLPAVGGGEVSLADYRGVSPVLLFFHMAVG